MNELGYLNRIALEYESALKDSPGLIRENLDFHIEQMNKAFEHASMLKELAADEIYNWAVAIEAVSEIDETKTIFEKIYVWFMKRFVNRFYERSLIYMMDISDICERLDKIQKRLMQIKAFST